MIVKRFAAAGSQCSILVALFVLLTGLGLASPVGALERPIPAERESVRLGHADGARRIIKPSGYDHRRHPHNKASKELRRDRAQRSRNAVTAPLNRPLVVRAVESLTPPPACGVEGALECRSVAEAEAALVLANRRAMAGGAPLPLLRVGFDDWSSRRDHASDQSAEAALETYQERLAFVEEMAVTRSNWRAVYIARMDRAEHSPDADAFAEHARSSGPVVVQA